MEIIKAVIPAAGLGTRFLPYTKALPKEMLPVLNKPAIQYIVQEGMDAAVKNFIMVVNKDKQALAQHFDTNLELEQILKDRDKEEVLEPLRKLSRDATFSYVHQIEPLGLGHAIWNVRHYIFKEYFGIMLPDDIIVSKQAALAQLIKVARQEKASVIAVQEVPMEDCSKYGMIGIKKQITPNLFQVSHLVEKPDKKDAPSNLAIIGRYVLSHKIFAALESIEAGSGGELQLTDAIGQMLFDNEKVFAYKVQGIRYDIGTPIGWLKANIGCALQDPLYRPYINELLEDKDLLDSYLYNQVKIVEHML